MARPNPPAQQPPAQQQAQRPPDPKSDPNPTSAQQPLPPPMSEEGTERTCPAAAMVRRGLGHELVFLDLPISVIEQYAVRREAAELRGIVAARLSEWAERVP